MTLRHDRQIGTKLDAATTLLRRVEDNGTEAVMPAVVETATDIVDGPEIISVYIDIVDGEPDVHAVGVDVDVDDDVPLSAYAFVLSVPAGDGRVTDSEVARAILRTVKELVDVYGLQGAL